MIPTTPRHPAVMAIAAACALLGLWPQGAAANLCTREQFAAAVDSAGASLRAFNAETSPKVQARVKELQKKRGWSDAELEQRAIEYLHGPRIAELDESANKLLTEIDELGDVQAGTAPDCERLAELRKAGEQLIGVVRTKSEITLARLDAALAGETTASDAKPVQPPPTPLAKAPAAKPAPAAPDARRPPAPEAWRTQTDRAPPQQQTADLAPRAEPGQPYVTPPAADLPPRAATDSPNGYDIDEVKNATRGFFGTISTNLGSVIEYAFSRFGRPAGYVLGTEGGGAFLAGVRYGKGELFMRSGERRQVYWHGPSLGYDFGAEGSRTLFLIYHVETSEQLFRTFGGVDGSAYLVGGVGLTVLKGGPVLMAPIRTGVGLRLGANIGYLRFTPKATWNPF